MKNSRIITLFCLTLCMLFILAGCKKDNEKANNNGSAPTNNKTEEKTEEKPSEEAVSLSDWNGFWNNMGTYLDNEEIQGAFESLGKKENMSTEEAKAAYVKKRRCDFNAMVVEGNKIQFLDGVKGADSKEIASGEYEFAEVKTVKFGDKELTWNVFKAKEADAKFKVLLLMPVDTSEALVHFHMRYGDDVEKIAAEEGWFPTFVKPETTSEQLIEEIAE